MSESPFEYNSKNHVALMFSRSLRKGFMPKDLVHLSPKFFKDNKAAFGALRVLLNHELVARGPKGWEITQKGVNLLNRMARHAALQDAKV